MIGCSVFTISLALSLLVLLAGLFLLAYAKKEGLGKLTKISSYVAILFGGVVFVGGLTCALFFGSCPKGKGCKSGKCPIPPHERMEMRHHKGMMMEGHHGMKKGGCHDMKAKDCCSTDKKSCETTKCETEKKADCCSKDKKEVKSSCCGDTKCTPGKECAKDGKCADGGACPAK